VAPVLTADLPVGYNVHVWLAVGYKRPTCLAWKLYYRIWSCEKRRYFTLYWRHIRY